MRVAPFRRRDLVTLLGGAMAARVFLPLAAHAQAAPSKPLRIGTAQLLPRNRPQWAAFEQRLRDLGYVEGKNLAIEYRFIEAQPERYAEAMRDLLHRNVDVIVASGPELSVKSALAATNTLPIVMIAIDYDPIALGYVASLARPGGNVTGVVALQIELAVKRLQLMQDAFPNIQGATVFWDRISIDQWQAVQRAAAMLGLRLFGAELHERPYDYEAALAEAPPDHRGMLILMSSPVMFPDRSRLAELALRHRTASMFVFREYAEAGGLISYGPSLSGMFQRAADYVERIAGGAKPADLPIEQPTKFELVINLKTAKAIGIELPTSLLLRADIVIE